MTSSINVDEARVEAETAPEEPFIPHSAGHAEDALRRRIEDQIQSTIPRVLGMAGSTRTHRIVFRTSVGRRDHAQGHSKSLSQLISHPQCRDDLIPQLFRRQGIANRPPAPLMRMDQLVRADVPKTQPSNHGRVTPGLSGELRVSSRAWPTAPHHLSLLPVRSLLGSELLFPFRGQDAQLTTMGITPDSDKGSCGSERQGSADEGSAGHGLHYHSRDADSATCHRVETRSAPHFFWSTVERGTN